MKKTTSVSGRHSSVVAGSHFAADDPQVEKPSYASFYKSLQSSQNIYDTEKHGKYL